MNIDDDLAAWAAAVQLTPAEADAIFERIRQPVLGARWWRAFNADLTATIVTSTRPRRLAA